MHRQAIRPNSDDFESGAAIQRRRVQDYKTPSGRRHGGAGRRPSHPGRAGARPRRALELQGRQVRLLLGRDQRHAEADVHDPAQHSERWTCR